MIIGMPVSHATAPHADPRPGATETAASGTLGWRRRIAFQVAVRASLMATSGRLSAATAATALPGVSITLLAAGGALHRPAECPVRGRASANFGFWLPGEVVSTARDRHIWCSRVRLDLTNGPVHRGRPRVALREFSHRVPLIPWLGDFDLLVQGSGIAPAGDRDVAAHGDLLPLVRRPVRWA